ncbi:hypothetical protein GCM10010452_73830 [Crossiella cryophila]
MVRRKTGRGEALGIHTEFRGGQFSPCHNGLGIKGHWINSLSYRSHLRAGAPEIGEMTPFWQKPHRGGHERHADSPM